MYSNAARRLGVIGKQAVSSIKGQSSYCAAECQKLGEPLVIVNKLCKGLETHEIRIKTKACGLNFATYLTTKGEYQVKCDPPFIPGNEISGEVVEVGNDVTALACGDVVIGIVENNGLAEEIVVPEMLVSLGALQKVTLPARLMPANHSTLSSLLVNYGTAWMGLTRKGQIKSGETVLITGASGGVGLAAVELAAKIFDCEVIAVCRESKAEEVRKAGASEIIDYTKPDLRKNVKAVAGAGIDIVFDVVGGDAVTDLIKSLAYGGRYITIGYTAGIPKIPANLLLLKSATAAGVWWGNTMQTAPEAFQDSINQVLSLYSQGRIQPLVQETYPLNKVNEAFSKIAARDVVGKLVVTF